MRKTQSLNGQWEIVFDPENNGKKKGFYKKMPRGRPISVPGVWELVKPFYDGVGWYKRKFTLSTSWENSHLEIKFGSVNYFAEVWLNGIFLGSHEGGYTPFTFDISSKALFGNENTNNLIVRVIDPPRDRVIEGFRTGAPLSQSDIPTWKAGWYYNFGGIWQDVEISSRNRRFVRDIFLEGSYLRKRFKATFSIQNKQKSTSGLIKIVVYKYKQPKNILFTHIKKIKIKKGISDHSILHKVPRCMEWNCETPNLYVTKTELIIEDTVCDLRSDRFGFRDFYIKSGHFYLNKKRIVLNGFLQQGVYAKTLVYPHDNAMAKKEMNLIKNNGFNYIRAHLKPSPIILDLADEMGILISGEPPAGWIALSEHTTRRCLTETRELVLRDRNRPCVVFWCMLNEAYHYRSFKYHEIIRLTKAMMNLTYKLDPSRFNIGNSGGSKGGKSSSMAYFPYSKKVRQSYDYHAYYGASQRGLKQYRSDGSATFVSFISEFGAFEAPPDFKSILSKYTAKEKRIGIEDYAEYNNYYQSFLQIFKDAGLKKLFPSELSLSKTVDKMRGDEARLMVSNIRVNDRYDGQAFCQLADASGEIFGATDIWRNPKQIFKGLARAVQVPLIVPFLDPRVLSRGQSFSLNLRIVNENLTGRRYKIKVDIISAAGKIVKRFNLSLLSRKWIDDLFTQSIKADWGVGRYNVVAKLIENGKTVNTNNMSFSILDKMKSNVSTVALFDFNHGLNGVLTNLGYKVEKGTNNFKEKQYVNILFFDQHDNPTLLKEFVGQLVKIVKLGGVCIAINPVMPLLYDIMFPKPVRRAVLSRTITYAFKHPIFKNIPLSSGIFDYELNGLSSGFYNNPYDIKALGGETLCGSLSSHMWTEPDCYFWGSIIDQIPLGRGKVITVNMNLMAKASNNIVADNLMINLINYAATLIKPGGEEKLLTRCIDPV